MSRIGNNFQNHHPMRRAAKVDSNQPEIVSALRKSGISVEILSAVGQGVPDLLCGISGKNALLEVKDGMAPKSQRKLTPDQLRWHSEWRGAVHVVESIEQALAAMEQYR